VKQLDLKVSDKKKDRKFTRKIVDKDILHILCTKYLNNRHNDEHNVVRITEK